MKKTHIKWSPLFVFLCSTVQYSMNPLQYRPGTVGHFLRKDDSCDRALVIYIVQYYVASQLENNKYNS